MELVVVALARPNKQCPRRAGRACAICSWRGSRLLLASFLLFVISLFGALQSRFELVFLLDLEDKCLLTRQGSLVVRLKLHRRKHIESRNDCDVTQERADVRKGLDILL